MYNIAVIGCGVIGLTTAVALQKEFKKLHKITIFTEKVSPHTTGDVAAGIVLPYLYQETDIKDVVKWSKGAHDYFMDLWRQGHADEAGICLQVVTLVFKHANPENPEWLTVPYGCERLSAEHLKKINQDKNENYKSGYNLITVSAEPLKLLPFLQKQFVRNGGEIKIGKITDFNEISGYDVIVNCTGLYSKVLAKDNQLTPARGQLVRVSAPWNFQTFLDEEDNGVVIVNYDTIVLGGTCQMGDTNEEPSKTDTEMILRKCYKLVPALQKAPIVGTTVGIRPVRTRIRLELETMRNNGRILRIVHNYGHGGCGISLSYGCALEAVDLVKQVLNYKHKL